MIEYSEDIAQCPLCFADSIVFRAYIKKSYYNCLNCNGIFLPSRYHISHTEEKERYDKHNNDVADLNYQHFVSPIVEAILKKHTKDQKGLDFGAGPGPVISVMLRNHNFDIIEYDPYYWNNTDLLAYQYDYIVCCEVMEHFNFPSESFKQLKNLLKPNGILYCMTDLFDAHMSFDNWYYKNDVTHVFFYQKQTLEWIKEQYDFSELTVEGRLIRFVN